MQKLAEGPIVLAKAGYLQDRGFAETLVSLRTMLLGWTVIGMALEVPPYWKRGVLAFDFLTSVLLKLLGAFSFYDR